MSNTANPAAATTGQALAAHAVKALADMHGPALDYSPGSLKLIEELLDQFSKQGLRSNAQPNTVLTLAGYFGEVLVRHAGAAWIHAKDVPGGAAGFPPDYLLVRLPDGTVANPIGKVAGRLDGDTGDNVAYFYQVLTSGALRNPG